MAFLRGIIESCHVPEVDIDSVALQRIARINVTNLTMDLISRDEGFKPSASQTPSLLNSYIRYIENKKLCVYGTCAFE